MGQTQDLFLRQLPLKSGHQRLIAGHYLGWGIENGFANVTFVGRHGRSIGEANGAAKNSVQRWCSACPIPEMAGCASFLDK
jgi:hypothetical protein